MKLAADNELVVFGKAVCMLLPQIFDDILVDGLTFGDFEPYLCLGVGGIDRLTARPRGADEVGLILAFVDGNFLVGSPLVSREESFEQ